HADLNESYICLRRRSHAIAMDHHFTTAAEDHLERRDHDGLRRVAQTHRRVLKNAAHHVELFPVFLLRFHQHQHDVCADAEVHALVADDESDEVFLDFAECKLQHLKRVAANGVHLRVKLETRDTVANVDQRGAGV